ncbi:PAS domain S-box protein [Iodobacter sp. LRB]|uniref:PAS domain S-box protein n=1 Tax=unclassified Iodobacter TaxID=235634 RepID=UPI0015D4F6EB|nr:PAS domain S-box protein [Iodobacter sp. BJB302]
MLLLFVASILLLTFYAKRVFQKEMLHLVSNQQLTSVSIIANDIDHHLQENINALEYFAKKITAQSLKNPPALQSELENHNMLQELFNAGSYISTAENNLIIPSVSLAQHPISYALYQSSVRQTLAQGINSISNTQQDQQQKNPIFVITVPIKNNQGQVIAALSGVINLYKPNFISEKIKHNNGKTGGYALIAPEQHLIIAATDQRLVMKPTPAGVNLIADRMMQGKEGSGIFVDLLQTEVFTSVKKVNLADWYVAAALPTDEAFFPIQQAERHLLGIIFLITLVLSLLIAWILKQQLSHLHTAIKCLNTMAESDAPPRLLPIVKNDEIGNLLSSVNHLLTTLGKREDALKQSELFIRTVTENIPGMLAYWTPDLHCAFANKAYCQWFNHSVTQIHNIAMQDLLGPELFQAIKHYIHGALEGKEQNYERSLIKSDGKQAYLLAQYIPHFQAEKIQGFFVLLTDITAIKQGEEQLRLSDAALKAISQGVLIADASRNIISVNPPLLAITGFSPEEFIGRNCNFLQGPLSSPETINAIRNALNSGKEFNGEIINYRKDGNSFWNDLSISPVFNENGVLTNFIGITRDITERKNSEKEKLNKQEQLLGMINTAMDAIVSADAQFNIILFNPAAEKLFGYSAKNILGQPIECLLPIGLANEHREEMIQFAKNKEKPRQMQGRSVRPVVARHQQGHDFPAEIAISYLENNGQPIFTAMIRDLTERKLLDEALMQFAATLELRVIERTQELGAAKLQAENANQAKSAFLANMSHEIRTPLNSVLGMAHLAQLTELTPKQRDYLQKITLSGTLLLDLINDILDFSKIEAGKFDLNTVDFNLSDLIHHISGLIQHKATEKGLTLNIQIDKNTPLALHGDDLRIKQVLLNLLSNSIKFTDSGSVTLIVHPYTEHYTLQFSIIDTGIGITPEVQKLLFQSFQQADNSITRKYGGSGLGLAISRQLVQLMGGELSMKSELGKGSEFTFHIVLNKAKTDPSTLVMPDKVKDNELFFKDKLILLADDHAFNQQIGSELLELKGAKVILANNGQEAIQLAQQYQFDAILMDVQMPEMDGITASQILRKNPDYDAVPIIAMTANISTDYRQRCTQAGMNHFIGKPVQAEKLYLALMICFRQQTEPELPSSVSPKDITPASEGQWINHQELQSMLGEEITRQRKYCERFSEAMKGGLATIDDALAYNQPDLIKTECHRLKAIANTVGALPLGELLAKLEKNEHTSEELKQAIVELKLHVQHSCAALKNMDLLDHSLEIQ